MSSQYEKDLMRLPKAELIKMANPNYYKQLVQENTELKKQLETALIVNAQLDVEMTALEQQLANATMQLKHTQLALNGSCNGMDWVIDGYLARAKEELQAEAALVAKAGK